jgi:hypothetical protein
MKNKYDYFIINYSNDFKDMYLDKDFNVLTITEK